MLQYFNHLSIRAKVRVCAIAILVLVLGMAGVVYIDIIENEARDQRVVRAADIVQASDMLLIQLTNMELDFRTYLLTGNAAFLTSYEASYQAEQQEQLHLAQLVGDDTAQLDQLHELDVAVSGWRNFLHLPTIRSRKAVQRTNTTANSLFVATALRGARDFNDIRLRLSAIRAAEVQRSDTYRQEAREANLRLRLVLLAGTSITGILSLGASWQALLEHDRTGLETWRDLSGGRYSYEEIVETLKDAPVVSSPDKPQTARMREIWGEDSPVFGWVATNLYRQDPGVLSALIDDFAQTAAGYDMDQLLPRIGCPVLLLQADPASGGIMTDAEVAHALTLLRQPSHTRLAGVSHVLHNEQKEAVLAALQPFLDSI
jgi:CHASE3 domain sensor protein